MIAADDAERPHLVEREAEAEEHDAEAEQLLGRERDARLQDGVDQTGVGGDHAEHDAADERRDVDHLAEEEGGDDGGRHEHQPGQVAPGDHRRHGHLRTF